MTGTRHDADADTDASQLTVHVPDVVRRDERFVPQIAGLAPGERVTLTVETSDPEGDWRSTTTYEAAEAGTVDLSEQAPVTPSATTGDEPTRNDDEPTRNDGPAPEDRSSATDGQRRADPMGPVWSLQPVEPGTARTFEWTPTGSHELAFTARAHSGAPGEVADSRAAERENAVATATTTVRHCDPDVTEHVPESDGYADAWYEPAGEGPHPAVVVLHGSAGTSMRARASLLASHGYAAFALRYLGTDDLPDHPIEVPLEHVQAAVDWFRERETVAGDGYAVYGVSMGAQLAFHLAVRDDDVDAVVSDAGGHVRFFGAGTGAWAADGDVLPYVDRREEPPERFQYDVDGTPSGRELFVQMLEAATTEERKAATVPVEAASADLLLLSGSDDELWPATMFGNALLARLDALDYGHEYEHAIYHEAGHAIGAPYGPTTWRPARDEDSIAAGGTPAAAADAAADGWDRILAHIDYALDAPRDDSLNAAGNDPLDAAGHDA